MYQDWTTFSPHSELSGSDYGKRIHAATLAAEKLELTNYWRGLYVALMTCKPEQLQDEWEYIRRVSDHKNPAFKLLADLKDQRKSEL